MAVDYSVFKSFCKTPTWDTGHASDRRRFMNCLAEVVHLKDFSPEAMGVYISQNQGTTMWPKSAEEIETAIEAMVRDAWAVKDFVQR